MLLIVLLIVYLNKTSQVAVGGEALEERVFEITSEDKLNIKLAQAVGVSHLAVSYPQGINCTLLKTIKKEPRRTCINSTVPLCTTRDVVRVQNITENCRERAEYCQYSFRTEEITQQTVICQRPADVVCDPECSGPSCDETYCERNSIVVCSTVHQTVAITEKKQKCGPSSELETTKICFTYPDASWVCREPRTQLDCDRESVRLVAHEVATPKVNCREKELEPLCLPANCKLRSNNTDCLTTDLPKQVTLEDQICEPCEDGRTKLRPVIVKEERCEGVEVREVCREVVMERDHWTKKCLLPAEKTSLRENEITEARRGELDPAEKSSRLVRLKTNRRRVRGEGSGEGRVRTRVNFKFGAAEERRTSGQAGDSFNDDQEEQKRKIFTQGRAAVTTPGTFIPGSARSKSPGLGTGAPTRRFRTRFSVRPLPVTVPPPEDRKSPRSDSSYSERGQGRESENRFPFIAWQNKDIPDHSQHSLQTSQPTTTKTTRLFRTNENVTNRNVIHKFRTSTTEKYQENKKLEKTEEKSRQYVTSKETSSNKEDIREILNQAVAGDTKDYVKLYNNIKNRQINESLIDATTPLPVIPTIPTIQAQGESYSKDRKVGTQITGRHTTTSDNLYNGDQVTRGKIDGDGASGSEVWREKEKNHLNASTGESAGELKLNNILHVIDHVNMREDRRETTTDTLDLRESRKDTENEDKKEDVTETNIGSKESEDDSDSDKEENESETGFEGMLEMCDKVVDKKERIKCRIVACFTDNQLCY